MPLFADSGNGAHLLFKIDLPNTPESTALVKRCIEAIALRFSDKTVAVDLTTFNPARIWKLYGTLSAKGDHTAERPHRLSTLLEVPEKIEVADVELLKKLASLAPQEPKRESSYRGNGASFDVESFIQRAGLEVAVSDQWQNGRKWILKTCPWNSDHQNRSAFVIQFASGAVSAGCHHNGCSGKSWADLKQLVDPERREWRSARPAEPIEKEKPLRKWIDKMETIEEQEIDWLWNNRIPRGRLTEFLGDPGIGKSHACQAIAADLSVGRALPFDQEPEAPLRTLILNFEENAGDTIKPHLRKLRADMEMIGVPSKSNRLLPSQFNVNILEQMFQEFPAALIVIDPVLAIMARKNTDRASDVRDILSPLADFAERRNCAIILVRHLNKSPQSRAIYRGQGSIDFNAIVRSSFVFGQDPNNPQRRLMAQVKNSLRKLAPTIEFQIDDDGVFRWGMESSESPDDVLGTNIPPKQRERTQLDAAKNFLSDVLADGPMASNRVRDKADAANIAWRTIWRAKEDLDIKASKSRDTGEWFWRLP